MKKYQIWKSKEGSYAISSLNCESIPPESVSVVFYATSVEDEKYKKLEVIDRDMRSKNALLDYLKTLIIEDGIFPIYNRIGEVCQQISNVPDKIMSSKEILKYLNDYTILPQETPPWEEIIYKLRCYSKTLSEEYYDRVGFSLDDNRKLADSEDKLTAQLDKDDHYFVSRPKENEGKKGIVFHLEKPNRPRRKWIILDEHYDYIKNAWVMGSRVDKRSGNRIEPPSEKKKVDTELIEIAKAKAEFYQTHEKPVKKSEFDWRKIEIHPLAHLIPYPNEDDRSRLKNDIAEKGILESLWLYEGKILDGRTRHELAIELDSEGKLKGKLDFKPFKGPGTARSFVMSMGINRRHLKSSQVAAIGVDQYLEQYEKEAKERLKTNMNGANSKNKGMNSMHSEKVRYPEKGKASILLAEKLKTNERYIQDAKLIKENSQELFDKIISGKITISKAKSQLFPKKKKKSYKFETLYKTMLNKILDLDYRGHEDIYRKMSKVYLKWNKRNDNKMISELNSISDYWPDLFNKKKHKFELVVNNNESELMEM